MKKYIYLFSLFFTLIFSSEFSFGAYTIQEGSLIDKDEVATRPINEHFQSGTEAVENKEWKKAVKQFLIVLQNSGDIKIHRDSLYYLGVSYYHLEDYQLANRKFRAYLKESATPEYFENVMKYKYAIAQQYQNGAKKHLLGWSKLPKWVPAKEDALEIYDEISITFPGHEIAAKALFAKAELLEEEKDYEESVETYQTLILRFPKTVLAAKSYNALSNLYLKQSELIYKNPDLLTLALINLKHYQKNFPKDSNLVKASENLTKMQEIYAFEIFKLAELFQRMDKVKAATLYYYTTIVRFPKTQVAQKSKEFLSKHKEILEQIGLA